MINPSTGFTSTDLIATASDALIRNGYQQICLTSPEWDTPTSRIFENEYNVVGIAIFDTCDELLRDWPVRQGSLVDVISRNIGHLSEIMMDI
jgi:hypothetical protein